MRPRAKEPISEARKSTWEAIGKGWGTILTLIVIGQEDDVDLSCDECRYNYSPPFDIIFGYFAGRHGLQYYCTFFCPLFGGILYILSRAVTLILAFTLSPSVPLSFRVDFSEDP